MSTKHEPHLEAVCAARRSELERQSQREIEAARRQLAARISQPFAIPVEAIEANHHELEARREHVARLSSPFAIPEIPE